MELYAKSDFVQWMNTLLDPLKPLYSPGCARLRLGGTGAVYPDDVMEMEAFSRPLWALAPFWAGGGSDADFERIYAAGLANGTDPAHPEYWGGFSDYDQRFVEMAAIACGLLLAPEKLWQPLSIGARENLARWLYAVNEHRIPDCNWQFFMILVNLALKERGMPCDEQNLAAGLAKIESYYLGDGWYRDGASCQKDYYISFAMHYYGLLYAAVMNGRDPERCTCFRQRAERFAQDFIYWFADDGAALPYGRSLTYRFGQGAFWAAYLFAGLDGIPLGVVKGILARHLAWWSEQSMTDRDGVLTIGYAYPNLIMAERYNAPGSPYWGMETLLLLALPDSHPFWRAEARPLPPLAPLKAVPKADMLMQRRQEDDVIAYPAGVCERYGHGHVPEKYAKFAYSTRFGFCCAHSQLVLHENCPDSMLAFVIDGSDYVLVRETSQSWKVCGACVEAVWSPFPGITVRSTVTPTAAGHTRRHEVVTSFECTAYDCGFAVEKFAPGYTEAAAGRSASVSNSRGGCTVRGRGGGEGCLVGAAPNANVLYKNSEIPAVRYRLTPGKSVLETEIITSYGEKS